MENLINELKFNKSKIMKIAEKIMLIIFILVILVFQSRHTLWLDELDWSIGIIDGKNLVDIYKTVLQTGENLPLFYIILYIVKSIFGYNEFILIFCTSTIFGFIGIYAVIKIAKEFFDENINLLTVFFIFCSYTFVGQVAWQLRPYGLLFCFSAWTLYFYLRRLKEDTYANMLKFCICMIFLMYSHWFGVLLSLCYAVVDLILFFNKKVKLKNIISYIIVGLAFLPTFIMLLLLHQGDLNAHGITEPTLYDLYNVISFLVGKIDINILLLIGGILLIVISSILKKNKNSIYINVITYSSLILVLVTFIYSKFISPTGAFVRDRYFVCIMPHVFLILAWTAKSLIKFIKDRIKKIDICIIFILIYVLIVVMIAYMMIYMIPNYDGTSYYEECAEYLSNQSDVYSDDTLVICSFGKTWIDYYFTNNGVELPKNIIVVDPLKYPDTMHMEEMNLNQFEYVVKDGEYVDCLEVQDIEEYKTIYYLEKYRTLSDEIIEYLEDNFESVDIEQTLKVIKLEKINNFEE